jgi:surface antigen
MRKKCFYIFLVYATQIYPHPAFADFITDHNLRAFISGRALQGETAVDRERWVVEFSPDGTFKEKNEKARLPRRGTWSVKGQRLLLMYDRQVAECRSLFLSVDSRQEWQECGTGRISSIITSPIYDQSGRDRNLEMAQSMRAASGMLEGLTAGLPADHPASVFVRSFNGAIIAPEARRLLSQQGQRMHIAAAAQTLDTGQTTRWNNTVSGESGGYEPLEDFVNNQGHKCQRVRSTVTVQREQASEVTVYCRTAEGKRYMQS